MCGGERWQVVSSSRGDSSIGDMISIRGGKRFRDRLGLTCIAQPAQVEGVLEQ